MTMEGTISHSSSMVSIDGWCACTYFKIHLTFTHSEKEPLECHKSSKWPFRSQHAASTMNQVHLTLNKLPWASRWNQKVYKFIIKNCVIELFTNLPPPLLDRPRGDGLKLYVLCAKATTIARRAAVQIVMMIRIRVFTCQWTRTELDGMWRVEEKRIFGNLLKKGWNS